MIPRIFNKNCFFEYDEDNVLKIIREKENKPQNRARPSMGNNLMQFRESRYVEE